MYYYVLLRTLYIFYTNYTLFIIFIYYIYIHTIFYFILFHYFLSTYLYSTFNPIQSKVCCWHHTLRQELSLCLSLKTPTTGNSVIITFSDESCTYLSLSLKTPTAGNILWHHQDTTVYKENKSKGTVLFNIDIMRYIIYIGNI